MRTVRQHLLALFGRPAQFVYHESYALELPGVPYDSERGRRILGYLRAERLLARRAFHTAEEAPIRALRAVHADEYLHSLQDAGALSGVLGTEVDDRTQDAFLLSQRYMVGGTVRAARLALASGRPAVNLGAGLHHAATDRGQGFCVFNDVAVAIADRRRAGYDAPVLVADLDLHDGDGTRRIFSEDSTVHTLSIHNRHLAPTEAIASTSVELGSGVEDDLYLKTVADCLPRLVDSVRPGLVFYLAGSDPAHDDRLGDWRISDAGLLRRDRLVVELFRDRGIPLVYLLAGGYGGSAWRHGARSLAWLLSGTTEYEPPETARWILERYRRLARQLGPAELTTEPAGTDWSLSEEDLLPGRRSSRFLGYYSRHGIEVAMERYGFLEELQARGFDRLRLDMQLGGSGDTLRLRTEDGDPQTVIELRARRDGRSLPDSELLFVEWLLMQNPRASFTAERPRLPDQRHPGLGLLGHLSAMLVLICDRLGLEGVAYVPSHYHIAAQSRSHFHFLDAAAEGRYIALRRAVEGLKLLEAVRAIEERRVRDRRTGEPFRWEPATMISPVSERLKDRLRSDERQDEVAAVAARFDLELLHES
jgi:acetoin utilization deacetylase AcuC-like enzyme